jgi:hypothetical protein
VLAGLIAELCRRKGIAQSLYYSWSKEFLEAGKKRLAGDVARQAKSTEVRDLRAEAAALKEAAADEPPRVCRQLYSDGCRLAVVGAGRQHGVEDAEKLWGGGREG